MIHGAARPTDQKEDSNNCCGFRAAGPPAAENGSEVEPADGQRPSARKEKVAGTRCSRLELACAWFVLLLLTFVDFV